MVSRVLLDTNLLVLLVVGLESRRFIAQHKRLTAYSSEDFDLLIDLLGRFGPAGWATTPSVLAEASNLICYTREIRRHKLMEREVDPIRWTGSGLS